MSLYDSPTANVARDCPNSSMISGSLVKIRQSLCLVTVFLQEIDNSKKSLLCFQRGKPSSRIFLGGIS